MQAMYAKFNAWRETCAGFDIREIAAWVFSEGHLSTSAEPAIRRELCDEAKRLAQALAEHAAGAKPETFALVALMHLHGARITARSDGAGGLLLFEEQDRDLWDQDAIASGLAWLARSAEGDAFSRYHAEAGIAAEHCLAPTFAQTNWERIVACYELLDRNAPSPIHTLNRAVAVAELRGADAALALLDGLTPPSWLAGSYVWHAVLSDLHRRAGRPGLAGRYRRSAVECAPSATVRAMLERRLGASDPEDLSNGVR
jgi:RNA polymerase sigma-70 factor (ECF subfamily)